VLIHVTGAKGIVGKEAVQAVAHLGEVHGTDVDDMDVCDRDSVQRTLESRPPNVLVHLAALKGNQPSRENPLAFFQVNTVGTMNLLEACRSLGVEKFIFLSSLTVHGPSPNPVIESTPWAPLHPYAGSKCSAEAMIHAYANAYGIRAVAFRPNFIVGPIDPPMLYTDNIVYDFIEAIQQTGVIELAGDGLFQREWLHPKDIASAIALAASSEGTGFDPYILSGHRTTMLELANTVVRKIGRGRVETNPNLGGFSLISSSEKAERELGWKPKVKLDTLISEIWDEYRSRLGLRDIELNSNYRN